MVTGRGVAVVIPAHNRCFTVTKAVGSVLGQTHSDLQCIVVDNGSTDGTSEALGMLSDPRLTVVSETRPLGPSLARNVGVSASADANWVTFLDSDDYWAPTNSSNNLRRWPCTRPPSGARPAASAWARVYTSGSPPGCGQANRPLLTASW